jgi:uncharacterized protein YabE (DUF348 family)
LNRKLLYLILFLFFFAPGQGVLAIFSGPEKNLDFSGEKIAYLNDNGLAFVSRTSAKTVEDFLNEQRIGLSEYDLLIPEKNTALSSGANIEVRRAMKIRVEADGKTNEIHTTQKTLLTAILESGTKLNPLDKIEPDKNSLPQNNLKVTVTRINIEEKKVEEDVDFKLSQNQR